MKPHLIGTLIVVLAAACGNGSASSEPSAAPTTAAGVSGTEPVGKTTTTGHEQSSTKSGLGQALPGAGSDVEATTPGGGTPHSNVRLLIPPPPGPVNTGDPCGPCNPPPGRK